MASLLDFLPIITILAVGAGIWQPLSKLRHKIYRKTELFNIFLLIGSFTLILPLTWIGIQPNGILTFSIGSFSIELIDFKGWCFFYFLLGLIIVMISGYYLLRKLLANLEDIQLDLEYVKNYRVILIGCLLLSYFVLELILPLRGFDALYYYLPEAIVFYKAERITEINYLSFSPVVKSPSHVLLYVYSYFVTGELAIQLIPFLFLLGLVFLIYDFSLEFFHDHSLALMSAIFALVLPFTYWLMNYWAFYQDLYLCYFFSVSCYFSFKWFKSPSDINMGLLVFMGVVASLLTKITAWVLPIILISWLPTGSKGKITRITIITLLGAFLCAQAATHIFIGAILPIIAAFLVVGFLILKENLGDQSRGRLFQPIVVIISVIIGSFWLLNRIALSESVFERIYDLYIGLGQSIVFTYPLQSQNPLLHTLETVHRVNFLSATGILILGTGFVLPWIILKVYALKNYNGITAPLIWILIFFGIWSAYYLDGSFRYLAPIITPMILCVSWGFYHLTKTIESKTKGDFVGILFAFLGSFSFYYLIPLNSLLITKETQEIIGLTYNQAALNYYSLPFILIRFALAIIFSLLILAYIRKDLVVGLITSIKKRINIRWISKLLDKLTELFNSFGNIIKIERVRKLLFCGIIIIPLVVQSYLLLHTQGDIDQFHAIHEYEYREEYKNLITVFQMQNQPLAGILTVRTPGLQYFTEQPVIDIYYQRDLFKGNPFFKSTNLSELIEILHNPLIYSLETDFNIDLSISIRFIVVPAISNLYYNVYISEIKMKSLLFQSLEVNQSFFTLLYENLDFLLYEVTF